MQGRMGSSLLQDEEDEEMEAETIQEKRAALEDANVEETALAEIWDSWNCVESRHNKNDAR